MRLACLLLVTLCACGDDSSNDAGTDSGNDGGVATTDADRDADGVVDSGLDATADVGTDASGDAGPDASLDTGPDTGPACESDSCGDATCGRSSCGYPCGECPDGSHCTIGNTCSDLAPPGELCIDAWGEGVVEGGSGYRVCETDDTLVQLCMCSGGGPDAWFGCGDCESLVVAGPRGSRCRSDDQCEGALPCHPSIRLCGESCDRGIPDPCPSGTRCGIPGDVAGVCLTECLLCGGDECGSGFKCAPGEPAPVCVPAGYAWLFCSE